MNRPYYGVLTGQIILNNIILWGLVVVLFVGCS
jgi:hypothetical protein